MKLIMRTCVECEEKFISSELEEISVREFGFELKDRDYGESFNYYCKNCIRSKRLIRHISAKIILLVEWKRPTVDELQKKILHLIPDILKIIIDYYSPCFEFINLNVEFPKDYTKILEITWRASRCAFIEQHDMDNNINEQINKWHSDGFREDNESWASKIWELYKLEQKENAKLNFADKFIDNLCYHFQKDDAYAYIDNYLFSRQPIDPEETRKSIVKEITNLDTKISKL